MPKCLRAFTRPGFAARAEQRKSEGRPRSHLVFQRRLGWSTPDGWGNTRIGADAYVKEQWIEMMADLREVNARDEPFSLIRFE